MLACGERLWSWLHPYMWLSSISWFPCLPGFPPQAFPTTISSFAFPFSVCPVNSNLCPEVAPQSLHFSSQLLHLLGHLSLSRVHMAAYCVNLIPFRLPQISCFTLTLICFSSDSDNCPDVEIGFQLQFQQPPRADPDLLTFVSPPPPSQFLHSTEFCVVIYIPLYIPVHSQLVFCMHFFVWRFIPDGERCTPHPHTPLPSCSPINFK